MVAEAGMRSHRLPFQTRHRSLYRHPRQGPTTDIEAAVQEMTDWWNERDLSGSIRAPCHRRSTSEDGNYEAGMVGVVIVGSGGGARVQFANGWLNAVFLSGQRVLSEPLDGSEGGWLLKLECGSHRLPFRQWHRSLYRHPRQGPTTDIDAAVRRCP